MKKIGLSVVLGSAVLVSTFFSSPTFAIRCDEVLKTKHYAASFEGPAPDFVAASDAPLDYFYLTSGLQLRSASGSAKTAANDDHFSLKDAVELGRFSPMAAAKILSRKEGKLLKLAILIDPRSLYEAGLSDQVIQILREDSALTESFRKRQISMDTKTGIYQARLETKSAADIETLLKLAKDRLIRVASRVYPNIRKIPIPISLHNAEQILASNKTPRKADTKAIAPPWGAALMQGRVSVEALESMDTFIDGQTLKFRMLIFKDKVNTDELSSWLKQEVEFNLVVFGLTKYRLLHEKPSYFELEIIANSLDDLAALADFTDHDKTQPLVFK